MALNDHARAALDELAGLGVSDPTPDDVVALQRLGERLDKASGGPVARGRGLPVRVGGVVLWPATCAAMDWWDAARGWFRGRGSLLSAAWAFALAHGREPELLMSLADREAATDAVKAWFRTVGATLAELDEACGLVEGIEAVGSEAAARLALSGLASFAPERTAALFGLFPELAPKAREGEDDDEPQAFFWRGYCAELAAVCGGSPAEWYGRDRRETVRAYAAACDAAALRAGVRPPPAPDAVVEAVRELRAEIAAIEKRRKDRAATEVAT